MTTSFFIEIEKLHYAYRKGDATWDISDINLQIRPDEFLLICGASGSGKSTLCRVFNGLIPHFYGGTLQGDIRVDGISTARQSIADLYAKVGMVFQNPETQLFNQTVEQEIAFGLESLGLDRAEIKKKIFETAEAVKICGLLNRTPHELSGGEQQLVSIAAILALRPRVIILDEPYANLDPENVRLIRTTLKHIRRQGVGIIISEHRLALTVADVDRMVVLHQGTIALDGPPQEVLAKDIEAFGLELPPSVRIGRHLGITPLPLDISGLKSVAPANSFPAVLKPAPPPSPTIKTSPALKVERVFFDSGTKPILRDVSFSLNRGECLAIVGANGAGKTTLLKHINGLYRPKRGEITVLNRSTKGTKVSLLARYVGVAFQNPNSQFFKLTVWDEIVVGAKALNCFDEPWIEELVGLFRLKPLLERAPYRLSEGEKKRVAFAAALAARPAILALDEPTAGQDMFFRKSLGELLARLQRRGQAILLITQDLTFAEQYAQRWLALAAGEMVAAGPPWQVMKKTAALQRAHLEPTDLFQLYGKQQ